MNVEVTVTQKQYLEAIGFTSYAYLRKEITRYSGMGGQKTRTLGEYIENFIYGKIAEFAFKNFLEQNYNLETLTEVDIAGFYKGIYLPDIPAFGDGTPLKFWIDIKELRRDQKWFLIPASSLTMRPYDAYVAVWVGLPEEHVLWLIENIPYVKENMGDDWKIRVTELAKELDSINCEVKGYVTAEDILNVEEAYLEKNEESLKKIIDKFGEGGTFYFDGKTALYDPEDDSWTGSVVGENIGYYIKSLERVSDWHELVDMIRQNQKIIGEIPIPKTKSGSIKKVVGLPEEYSSDHWRDLRLAAQDNFEKQLNIIYKNNNNNLKRIKSWFSESLKN
ncbi:MAG: hypothetical protein QXZ17_15040 [Nitrososphaerota archaeon]